MPGISDTISRLSRFQAMGAELGPPVRGRLTDLGSFGSNPGNLRARVHVPERVAERPALVVVLHGCTQTADGYDIGSGWSRLADRHGFVLLFPEQQRQNNPNLCFNWFVQEDSRRGHGEALSIRQMIATMIEGHGVDPDRVFVTGLSAGGAMAAVMLATYPEAFAGGAVIAGLPFGCAHTVPEAFERMRGQGLPRTEVLADRLRRASDHSGPWPTLSVWHGTADATVSTANADAIVGQWRAVQQLGPTPTRSSSVGGHSTQVWCDDNGRAVIEDHRIAGMGHGTPIATDGEGRGSSAPYMLDVGISSTLEICRSWELLEANDTAEVAGAEPATVVPAATEVSTARQGDGEPRRPRRADHRSGRVTGATSGGVGRIIEDALRAAGLMR